MKTYKRIKMNEKDKASGYYLLITNNKYPIQSSDLKNRLLSRDIFENKCYKCNKIEWEGEDIPLELHHKDCNRHNNNLSNLIILCANCHTITHRIIKRNKGS